MTLILEYNYSENQIFRKMKLIYLVLKKIEKLNICQDFIIFETRISYLEKILTENSFEEKSKHGNFIYGEFSCAKIFESNNLKNGSA